MHDRSVRDRNLIGAFALAAADAMRRATEEAVGQGGASAAALVTIGAYPGRSLERLRVALEISQPGTVRLVERLEHAGWVERRPSAGRASALHLTAGGEALVDRLLYARERALAGVLEGVEPAAVAALAAAAEQALAARTSDRAALERQCRLCLRAACDDCPVAGALRG
jgi:MarR family transcriptional repressor of emrRAB